MMRALVGAKDKNDLWWCVKNEETLRVFTQKSQEQSQNGDMEELLL